MVARIVPVLHNVSSVQRLVDFARLVYNLGLNELVVTKAYGAAAQHGIAEAGRLSYKLGKGLVVLPDLSDAVELMKPEVVLLVDPERAEEDVDVNPPVNDGVMLVVFNGGEAGFAPHELRLGKPVYIKSVSERLGAVAEAAIILYQLTRIHSGSKDN